MKTPTLLVLMALFSFVLGIGMGLNTGRFGHMANIEHDGHLFIQTKTSTIHSPRCSCQSSIKAMSAQTVKQAIEELK